MLKNALSALYLLEGSIRPPPKVRAGGGVHTGSSVDPIGVPLFVCMISLEPVYGISLNLHGYIIRTSLRADYI